MITRYKLTNMLVMQWDPSIDFELSNLVALQTGIA